MLCGMDSVFWNEVQAEKSKIFHAALFDRENRIFGFFLWFGFLNANVLGMEINMKTAETRLWNDGWEFCELPVEESSYEIPKRIKAGEAASEWKPVDIPHDWMIYETHALYRDSVGWYRKVFFLEELAVDEQALLRFDGVYMDTTVYVNGESAGEWKYGYSTFEIDMTPYLKVGKNEVYVRVVYRYLNTRWYSGAGIYRNVWFKTRNRTHIVSDGIYITPVFLGDNAKEAANSRW